MRDLDALVHGKNYIFKLEEKQRKTALYSYFEILMIKTDSKIPLKRFICDTLNVSKRLCETYIFTAHYFYVKSRHRLTFDDIEIQECQQLLKVQLVIKIAPSETVSGRGR